MNFLVGAVDLGPRNESESTCLTLRNSLGALLPWQVNSFSGVCFATTALLGFSPGQVSKDEVLHSAPHVSGAICLDYRLEVADLLGWSRAECSSRSDRQLFTAAWAQWGEAALTRIAGAFAVAIWNERDRQLTLVRDHAGEQPLFFVHRGDLLAFSSLPLPLRAIEHLDTSLDEEQWQRHLALLTVGPTQTLFKNIRALPPGHLMTFRDGVVKVTPYWHPIDAPATRYRRDEEYVEAFLELFDRAVGARLPASGKIGSELSGGMDSSSVTATAARLLGDKQLTAFTAIPQSAFADVNPAGRFGNEGPAAARLAAMYPNIEHVLIEPSKEELVGRLWTTEAQGGPVFNPTNILWGNAMFDQCRERGITVLLTGTRGNATLSASGLIGLSELFRKGQWMALAKMIYQLRQRSYTGFRRAISTAIAPSIPSWIQRRLSPDEKSFSFDFSPLHPEIIARHHLLEQSFNEMYGHMSNVEDYQRKTYEYFDSGPSNAVISLGWNVEVRDPTADKRIFEFCYSIPIEQYLVGGQTRSLVRRAMRGRVPDEILDCRDRGLQAADWYLTLGSRRQELLDELALIRLSPMANRLLDLDRLQTLLENWPTSGFEKQEVIYSWHYALSRGIAAGHFIRKYE